MIYSFLYIQAINYFVSTLKQRTHTHIYAQTMPATLDSESLSMPCPSDIWVCSVAGLKLAVRTPAALSGEVVLGNLLKHWSLFSKGMSDYNPLQMVQARTAFQNGQVCFACTNGFYVTCSLTIDCMLLSLLITVLSSESVLFCYLVLYIFQLNYNKIQLNLIFHCR